MKTEVTFRKFDVARQIVYGVVYAPLVADSQGDWASHESIEKMAHDFNSKNRANAIDVEHNQKPSGALVVESFIARKGDQDFPEGSWSMGIKTPDHIWQLVKTGRINGLSMFGRGERIPRGLPGQPAAKNELVDGEIVSVSLVGRAANKETFVMTKSDDSLQALAKQFETIAAQIQATTETIKTAFAAQQVQIDQLSKGADGRIVKTQPAHNPNVGRIDRVLRKRARLQERLDDVWERPDMHPENAEAELRAGIQKTDDKLFALGHADARAGIDTNSAFFQRGGTSTFLQGSASTIEDVLGVGNYTRQISKADEDAINVENCLVL